MNAASAPRAVMKTALEELAPAAASGPRIGPNAVLQTLGAVEDRFGPELRQALEQATGLPGRWPDGMIPEAWFVSVVAALRERSLEAEAVLVEAGRRTAVYVAGHRIPAPVRTALRWLPRRLAVPALLEAFRHHAWTFAGAGTFGFEGRFPPTLVLWNAPTCRPTARGPAVDEASPGGTGGYYAAAFEGLLQLAAPGCRVRETACRSRGADACRFTLTPDP